MHHRPRPQTSRRHHPASTQRPKDATPWPHPGGDTPDHNRTKIGRIRPLSHFGSAMSGMHLASRNIKNFPKILFYGKCLNCRPEDIPRTSRCMGHFERLLGRSQDVSPKPKEQAITNFLVSNTHFGALKLKIFSQKCLLYLCSKLTSCGRPKNVTHRTSLSGLYKTSLGRFSK